MIERSRAALNCFATPLSAGTSGETPVPGGYGTESHSHLGVVHRERGLTGHGRRRNLPWSPWAERAKDACDG
jgi:hypothetical protein